jgi:hypothetical protein
MQIAPGDAPPLEGRQLTDWSVLPGGTQVRLDFIATDGRTHRIILGFDALTGLLMTLPRMLQSALDSQFADGSMRVVQRLSVWRIEQIEGSAGLILRLGTPDGFEVAFALHGADATSLGASLLAAPDTIDPRSARRPH